MAYFDNAATTFPKPEIVHSFMSNYYMENGASVGRGNYKAALSAGGIVSETREKISNLLHCQAKQVVFTPTATIALNIIIQGLMKMNVQSVYISPFEHNAVTRTLHAYEKAGRIVVRTLSVTSEFQYDLERIRYQFEENRPDLIVISHASNVTGLIAPAEDVFKLGKLYDAYTVLDMAQTAGLVDCNIGLDLFDFAVFAGHKTLYGPTGISGFVMKPEIALPSVIFGGTGYDSANQDMPGSLPERFEMGTQNVLGIAGLHAALSWNAEIGIENIWDTEHRNRERLLSLLNRYSFIKTVGINNSQKYVGIVSCLIDGISSDSAAGIFDRCGIAVRTGLQCAPFAHKFLGTYPAGTIRFSVGFFTNDKDFDQLEAALDYIEENL